ncbi:PAS domain S-box protein [Maridesulfovibrio zosterae]|uniref:PAS domain S-box protein n=1 Tax=Maridesulfovibrio zosterae TaxID=82171 RepID=UPI0004125D37|nr:PAS domain S-box protein [Maridesulfovibrio zosterae]
MYKYPQRTLGLTAQLLIPMLALVMVMGIFIFSWSFYLSKTTLEDELKIDLDKTETIIDLAMSNTLTDMTDDLIEMTVTPEFKRAAKNNDSEYISQKMYDFMSSRQGYLLDVLSIYKNGKNWIEEGSIELPMLQLRNSFNNNINTTPTWAHISYRSLEKLQTILFCAIPIFDEQTGEITGILYGGIDLNSNVSFIDMLKKVSSSIDAALFSRNRLIISSSNPSKETMKKLLDWAGEVKQNQFKIYDNLVYSTVQLMPQQSGTPLFFTFSRKNPSFQSLKKNYMKNLGILLSLATLLAIFTSWALQKRILKALKNLTDYAHAVATGEQGLSFKEGQVREFNQLGKTLETMVSRLDENSTYISRLFSAAKAPIINCDLNGVILDMNPAAEKLIGFSNNITDYNLSKIFPAQYAEILKESIKLAASEESPPVVEIPVYSGTGDEQFFIWTFSPVQMDRDIDPNFILLQGLDVTQNRRAMKKAHESEARLRQIIDLLPQDIFANDMDGKFLLVNRIKALKLGLNVEEITGKDIHDVILDSVEMNRILEDDKLVLSRNEKMLTEESFLDENRDTHWMSTTRVPYISAETNTPAVLTISMDITRIKEVEQELQSLNKELVERVTMRTTELENANTALLKSMDELRQTQDKLVETEKMASLGELVAGVAHEINTPLGISVTSASFMKEMIANLKNSFESGEMKRSDLEKCLQTGTEAIGNIMKNLERSARLISNFKQLAVDQASDDIRRINLNEYIQGIVLSLKPKLKEHNHNLKVNCPNGLEVKIPPGSLMQVITNLVINSLTHAFPDRDNGNISIVAKQNGNGILLQFSDDGIGMGTEQLLKVFEPFYTTARSSGSAGLGMHLVYNIITRALKGRIECSSSLGEGTSYEIWFPMNSGE